MKYIRTNDGIIESSRVKFLENGQVELTDGKYSWRLDRFPILNQADTIKELCDGFVITSKQGHIYDTYGNYSYELKEVLPQAKTEEPDEDWNLYGVILIDGIIKPVAVANAQGDLELL